MNLTLLGGFAAVLAIVGFIIYRYRTKRNMPLIPDGRDKLQRDYPTECPCGCGLHWAGDMPYPPHYTTPPFILESQLCEKMKVED